MRARWSSTHTNSYSIPYTFGISHTQSYTNPHTYTKGYTQATSYSAPSPDAALEFE